MTPAELETALRRRTADPDTFLARLWELLPGDALEVRTYAPGEMSMYRTKGLEGEKPAVVQELSYPPVEKCEMQRANIEGEQVFYASSKLPATILESRVEKGDRAIVSKWKNAKELHIRAIPTDSEPESAPHLYKLLFTDPDTSIYAYSSRVAHRFFESDPETGLLYPSRLDEQQNDNIALSSIAADGLLTLVHASEFEVTESGEDGTFKVRELDFALPQGHELDWKGRARVWPDSAGELQPRWNGWGFDCFDRTGKLIEPV